MAPCQPSGAVHPASHGTDSQPHTAHRTPQRQAPGAGRQAGGQECVGTQPGRQAGRREGVGSSTQCHRATTPVRGNTDQHRVVVATGGPAPDGWPAFEGPASIHLAPAQPLRGLCHAPSRSMSWHLLDQTDVLHHLHHHHHPALPRSRSSLEAYAHAGVLHPASFKFAPLTVGAHSRTTLSMPLVASTGR